MHRAAQSIASTRIHRAVRLNFVYYSAAPARIAIRDDVRNYLDVVATDVDYVDPAVKWEAIRPLRAGSGRKGASFLQPAPMLLDKTGKPLHDSKQRADMIFWHFCEVESGRPVQPKRLMQEAFELQLRQFDSLPIPDAKLLASRQDLEDAFRASKDGGFLRWPHSCWKSNM